MKVCRACGKNKPLSEFYAHKKMTDGRLHRCKECVKSRVRRHREDNIEEIREYDRKRGRDPKRVEARRAYQKKIRKETPDKIREYHERHHEKYPERRRARLILGNAIRSGQITKGPCEKCGSDENIHGHHDDYGSPLDVRWLCMTCHANHHREKRERERQDG